LCIPILEYGQSNAPLHVTLKVLPPSLISPLNFGQTRLVSECLVDLECKSTFLHYFIVFGCVLTRASIV